MNHLVIGLGAAGANAAETLRAGDASAQIAVLNGEQRPFYLRLDLEGIFQGKPAEQLMPRPPQFWEERGIRIVPDRVQSVDVKKHEVQTVSGKKFSFDRLLVAVGASPRKLEIPGRELGGIIHYHTLDDALAIHSLRERVRKAVIIGGGILGLELAHAACMFGWQVTLLVRGGFAGSPMVDASGSARVLASLEKSGVTVIFHDEAASFEGKDGRVTLVRTTAGRWLECDLVGICAGVVPDLAFLEDSGLLEGGQLIVNERMQTSSPDIFAAGDCAVVRKSDGRLVHCHTWNVASAQARVAARNMSGADSVWAEGVLYNLDYLFDQEFAMLGPWEERHLSGRVLYEFPASNSYCALVTRDGILESAFLLGDRSADRRLRKLISACAVVKEPVERVFNEDVSPEDFLRS